MQSSAMTFLPNIATAKLEMRSLYRKYANMFGIPSNDSTVGCHVTRTMSQLPVLLIDRTVFSTGTAVRSIAVSYGALILRWLLNRTSAAQRTLISRAMTSLSCWCGSLPFFVGIGVLIARLYDYTMVESHIYGKQFILGHSANLRGESAMAMQKSELCNEQPFLSSFFGHKRDYAHLALQFLCYPASLKVSGVTQKKLGFNTQRIRSSSRNTSSFWRIMARNEQYLAYMVVLVALQLFLRLSRVNVTTLYLPMLSRATSSRSSAAVIGNMVLVLVNSCGVLGSALTAKQYGREVTFAVGALLMAFCQVTEKRTELIVYFYPNFTDSVKPVTLSMIETYACKVAIPLILEVQIGVGGGTRMPTGYTAAMFFLTCVVSCGLSWSWGSFFWTVPGRKVHSAGQVVALALNLGVCFAQMKYFLLVLCRLKNAILAYYAMWIWS